jgi:hypothetical protein
MHYIKNKKCIQNFPIKTQLEETTETPRINERMLSDKMSEKVSKYVKWTELAHNEF